ncbi:MAG: hypothetical protein AAFZ18_07085 [Myxococcota bacterium]
MTWFEALFGVPEDPARVREQFRVEGEQLVTPGGRRFGVGRFETPSLGELRARGRELGRGGAAEVSHEVVGDVLELHALPENERALFQAASQFNCLEFPSPDCVPEDGITNYAHDLTQGPACALAAAAAALHRNYFVPVTAGAARGQSREHQLDLTRDLAGALGSPERFFTVRNGYTDADPQRLNALAREIEKRDRDALLQTLRIGVQSGVEVTFARRFSPPARQTLVSQAFCSAVSCGYVPGVPREAWAPLATLVLDAAYEATLWAAVIDVAEGRGSGRVWLTFLGGGVFDNDPAWIRAALQRAFEAVDGFALDIRVAHFRDLDPRYL